MKNSKIIIIIVGVTLLVLCVKGQLQKSVTSFNADLTAPGNGTLFILRDNTVMKLDSNLEVVKTITLKLEPDIPPAEPNLPSEPGFHVEPNLPNPLLDDYTSENMVLSPGNAYHIDADQQYVYVFYLGTIIVLDHNLNQVKSKTLD